MEEVDMMLFILIILIVAFIFVLYALLKIYARKDARSHKTSPRKEETRTFKSDPLKNNRRPLPEDVLSSDKDGGNKGFPADDAVLADMRGDLRKYMEQGIEVMFSDQNNSSPVKQSPLMSDDIEPQTLNTILQHIGNLNAFRSEHSRLQKLMYDPSIQMSDLGKTILADPVMTAKILRMANSPYFGMQNKIDSISHALMILGLQNIKNILYREGLLQILPAGSGRQRDAMASLWKHATITSVCASYLSDLFEGLNQGTLFTLGIIHDIGKLIILGLPPSHELNDTILQQYPEAVSIQDEDRMLGINHAVIGKMALEQWGFSDLMIHSVAMHHMPSYTEVDSRRLHEEKVKYMTALFLADQISKLFAGRNEGTLRVDPLLPNYRLLIDRNKLINKINDPSFLSQIREAEILADSEYPGSAPAPRPDHDEIRTGPYAPTSPPVAGRAAEAGATMIMEKSPLGMTIGRYEILEKLGQGAMGTVYLGRDPLINREVAVKVLNHGYGNAGESMAEVKKRFFGEAEAAGRLEHPNLVTVYDVGDYRGTAYIAMERLDGANLAEYCEKNSRLPVATIFRIVATVAKALDYAHAKGVVHRDIKPGNIHILKNGEAKVVDFGIARMTDAAKTATGIISGSPYYMSPEQIEGQPVDGRSDLFSLGVVMFELLAGEKPFSGDTVNSLMHRIITQPPAPIKTLVPDISSQLVDILEKAMAKDRADRYQNGQEMANDIMACLALNENPPGPLR